MTAPAESFVLVPMAGGGVRIEHADYAPKHCADARVAARALFLALGLDDRDATLADEFVRQFGRRIERGCFLTADQVRDWHRAHAFALPEGR